MKFFTVIAMLIPITAVAQLDDYEKALSNHQNCVLAQAKRYASTRESPSDIAEAAIAKCVDDRIELRKELTKPLNGVRLTPEEVIREMDKILVDVKRGAIANVFFIRYPKQ